MRDNLFDVWQSGPCWTIIVSFKLILSRVLRPRSVTWPMELLALDDAADTVLIAANNARIKCFRVTLVAQSPVFWAMFRNDTRERQRGEVELRDLSEQSVIALTRYLATGDLKAIQDNSQICFELFQAAHMYEIKSLEEKTAYFLCNKESGWYSAKVALHLFYLWTRTLFPLTTRLKTRSLVIYIM